MSDHHLHPKTAVLITADILVLARLTPDWGALTRDLSAPRGWVSRVGADTAAINMSSALLWLAACWMALGLMALLASVMPGRIGRVAAQLSERALPAAVRRIVVGAAGVSLALGPIPALAEGVASPSSPAASSRVVTPAINWPSDHGSSPNPAPTVTPSSPAAQVNWPSTGGSAVTPPATTRAPSSAPKPAAPPPAARPADGTTPSIQRPAGPQGSAITVKPGESLWLIAAHRLGPVATDAEIAAEWPRWYAANETVIGSDPAVLQPGQQLTSPSPSTAEDH